MTGQDRINGRLQFSLQALFVLTALLAVVLGLTAWTSAPEIPVLSALVALVVLLWRFTQASRAGLILLLIGTPCLARTGIMWAYRGDPWATFFPFPEVGSVVLGLSILVFVLAPLWKEKTIVVQLTCAATTLALLVLWWLIVPPLGEQAVKNESIRQYADTMLTFRSLIKELERIHSTTGSYPKDEDRWVAIRGAPLPKTEYGGPFFYQRDGGHYRLSFLAGFFGNLYFYDSSAPERGIFMVPW